MENSFGLVLVPTLRYCIGTDINTFQLIPSCGHGQVSVESANPESVKHAMKMAAINTVEVSQLEKKGSNVLSMIIEVVEISDIEQTTVDSHE